MTGGSLAAWLISLGAFGTRVGIEVLFGMLAPLLVATVTLVAAERIYRRSPEQLTKFMIAAFGAKLALFAAYVLLVPRGFDVRPVPFIASFAVFFIALHTAEALRLRQLLLR
jgi:hypothetical protein